MEKKKWIGFYDYTVLLTYFGMIFAFIGIIAVINEAYADAITCLMFAGVCDMFDGTVASTKERNRYEKHFGIQIDSSCDLISFGVLPALFVYMITEKQVIIGILVCAYVLCGLIRLAYFDVQEYERQEVTDQKRESYLGVPITTSAIVIPIGYLLYSRFSNVGLQIFPILMILLSVGFVAGIEIKKPNIAGKIAMIVVGFLEMVGVLVLVGVKLV